MNGKKMRRINRHCDNLMVEWLRSISPESEAGLITLDTFKNLLPQQTHFYGGGRFVINAFAPKWFRKRVKRLSAHQPIESITLQQVKDG